MELTALVDTLKRSISEAPPEVVLTGLLLLSRTVSLFNAINAWTECSLPLIRLVPVCNNSFLPVSFLKKLPSTLSIPPRSTAAIFASLVELK
jgi:hypothetical protein